MSGRTRHQRGVSLIEALVAFAILAFGMLGVVGMQGTMRTNADLARQRAEAVRLGQDSVEEWRGFSTQPTTANRMAYQDVAGSGSRTVVGTNATYTIARRALAESVTALTVTPERRGIVVDVTWQDRTGQQQLVRLSSAVSGVEPDLAASLVLATRVDPVVPPMGRHRAIPRSAIPVGIGRSGFVPPGQTGLGNRIAWVFDNGTAAISLCLTNANATGQLMDTGVTIDCTSATKAVLIGGFVRFDTAGMPTSSSVADPIGPVFPSFGLSVLRTVPDPAAGTSVDCFQDTLSNFAVPYYCAVPVTSSAPNWSGVLLFGSPLTLAPNLASASNSLYKVCRYHASPVYVSVGTARANQNFAIIKAGDGTTSFTCPTGGTPNTWAHQPII